MADVLRTADCQLYREKWHDEGFVGIAGKPFIDQGSISELLDDVAVFINLRAVIEKISQNAVVA